ncbi:HAUS augmin-like complex subunit 6 [Holothuria leucospilota]|uniref:HAUS augmin-like complex subunit 6 n=1 Tax=Holothuria leucospilota TaxID=206669 RepID=A0A9Q1BP03_HOLLE|nr:HAUS augmin-like complex subunit 6 [Holothuria leucospilota]
MNRSKPELSSNPLDMREIVFSSLLLLGFDTREMEDKYNIPFTKDMFSLPNKKGFEVVMHFLFERLNAAMTQERFRHCWPILDKKQEQNFRKTISAWLTEISKEDEDANLPRIVPSLFMSPGGDKFYTLLFYFTNFVMLKITKNEYGVKTRDLLRRCTLTSHTKQFAPVMAQTIQASTVMRRKNFLHCTRELVQLQNEWKQHASILVKEYRSLSKKIRELEHSIREEEHRMIAYVESTNSPNVGVRVRSSGMTDGEWDVLAVKRAQRVQKVRDLWRSIETCCQDQTAERAVVDSITAQRARKDTLDAAELPVQVPEILLKECEQEIQRRRINNIYEGGKLDLVSLIRLWNLALRLYMEKLNEAPLPDFEEMIPSVVTQVHTQNAHLANARALRNSLTEEVLPDLERSVMQLLRYREDGVEVPTRDTKASPHHFLGNGVGLLPPTPPVSFDPAATPKTQATPFQKASSLFQKSPENVDTPEVMTQLRESVNRAALKKTGLAQGTPTSSLHEGRLPTQSGPKFQKPHQTREVPRKRNKSATSHTRLLHETPVAATSHSEIVSRHPIGRRMIQTTVKKKKSALIQKPPGTERRKPHAQTHIVRKDEPSSEPTTHASMDKAHSILIDQIVDSVMSGSKSSERSSPTLTPEIQSGEEEASLTSLAVEDPLGSLGLDAFVSRDKLRHSPVEEKNAMVSHHHFKDEVQQTFSSNLPLENGSTLLDSSVRSEIEVMPKEKKNGTPREPSEGEHIVETASLIDLGTEDALPGITSDKTTQLNADFAAWNDTLQRVPPRGALPPMLNLQDNIKPSHQMGDSPMVKDLLYFVESEPAQIESAPATEMKDYGTMPYRGQLSQNPPFSPISTDKLQANVEHSKNAKHFVSPLSPEVGSFLSPNVELDLNKQGEKEDVSNWHLDEELPEIFQTRTPQLPKRLRQKISEGASPMCGEDLERNTPGSSISQLSLNSNSNTSSYDSSTSFPEARKLQMTSSIDEDDSATNGIEKNAKHKRRFQSGTSQKSVTFSEPLQEEDNNEVEFITHAESISEETMPVMNEESFSSSPLSPSVRTGTLVISHEHLKDKDALSNEYLVSSPQPHLRQFSHIDDAFSIDLESLESYDTSFHLNRPIEDLLEHVSPTVSPSQTPQITRTNRSHHISMRKQPETPDYTPELPLKSRLAAVGSDAVTPLSSKNGREFYLSQRLTDLRIQSPSLGVNGSPHHLITGLTKASPGLNLLDEDESLLIPKSPVL